MKLLPLVSVIVPIFNPTDDLLDAINSFNAQTYPNIEVILVDDNSVTGRHLFDLVSISRFSLKKIFLSENSGGCARPLNVGLAVSSGYYVCVCAQDDFFYPNKIELQVDFMLQNPSFEMVFSDCDIRDNTSLQNDRIRSPQRRGGMIFNDLILQRFYIPSPTVMLKKEIFLKVGFYDEKMYIEDWDMHLRISKDHPIGYIPKPLAVYRIRQGSMSHSADKSMSEARMSVLRKWCPLPIQSRAITVARFLDFQAETANFRTLIIGFFAALVLTKQPIRIIRIFFRHVRYTFTGMYQKHFFK